jgi:hypothetical protein
VSLDKVRLELEDQPGAIEECRVWRRHDMMQAGAEYVVRAFFGSVVECGALGAVFWVAPTTKSTAL